MIAYDLHVHTCLSPCADDDMTPAKVVDRAVAGGLDVIGIADHNTMDNLEAACFYAEDKDIVVIPGIEVESSEEVHVLCLFPDVTSAKRMDRVVRENMHTKYNKAKTFGNQLIYDEFGDQIGEDHRLLRYPTKMTIEDIFYVARQMRGVAIYAHVDNKANSVLSLLGTFPQRPEPKAIEVTNTEAGREVAEGRCADFAKPILFSSNAHSLDAINTKENSQDLESFGEGMKTLTGKLTAQSVVDWLRSYEGI